VKVAFPKTEVLKKPPSYWQIIRPKGKMLVEFLFMKLNIHKDKIPVNIIIE